MYEERVKSVYPLISELKNLYFAIFQEYNDDDKYDRRVKIFDPKMIRLQLFIKGY